jgi:hypothetical protein
MPPTPGSLLASSRLFAVWGTRIDSSARSPVDKLAELIASRFDIPLAKSLEDLCALSAEHRYVLVECLGASRHSAVYAAVDSLLARFVAIKIHRTQGDDADNLVLAEVRAASQLNHPNIVQIHDLGKHDGWLFSVTELCDEDMNTWCIRHGWLDILARIVEAGEGLARLHAAGIIHGDIKPANVLITNGTAKLADFGMAATPGRSTKVVGTPGYMAPEIAVGLRTGSGDLFALAATAWACLFDELPYGPLPKDAEFGDILELTVTRAMAAAFAEPQRKHPGMPGWVVEELKGALCWDPRRRPSLGAWIDRLRIRHASEMRRASVRARLPWAHGWSSKRALAFAATFLLAFGGVTAYVAMRGDEPTSSSSPVFGIREPLNYLVADNLRLRAQVAACIGDGTTAVDALHEAWGQVYKLPPRAQIRLANSASQIAMRLELLDQLEHAQMAWSFATILHGRVGQFDERDAALRSVQRLVTDTSITPALPRSK